MYDNNKEKRGMAAYLRNERALVCAPTKQILSKVDDELSKEAVDPDLLEEPMEQLLLIHDYLDKIEREIEKQGGKLRD